MHSVPHLHICFFCGDTHLSSAGLQTSQSFIYCLTAYLSHVQESPDTSTHRYCRGHNIGQILCAQQLLLVCYTLCTTLLCLMEWLVKETTRRSEVHVVSEMRHFFSNHIMFSSNISIPLEALKSSLSSISKYMDVLAVSASASIT